MRSSSCSTSSGGTSGIAILYVSHDLGVVRDISDRVVVMYAGQVVEEAPSRELFRAPAHPYTKGLMGSTLGVSSKGRLSFVAGSVPHADQRPYGCHFAPRCAFAQTVCSEAPVAIEWQGGRAVRCVRHAEIAEEQA